MGGYKKTTWVDRNVQYPSRYRDQNNNQLTFTPDEGNVTAAGTPLNQNYMNHMEEGIFAAFWQSGAAPMEKVTSDLVYSSGDLVRVDEFYTDTSILIRKTDLNYTSGDLTSVRVRCYDSDGTTVLKDYTDTLNYTSGVLETVTRTVSV